jgi:hypothetical protein
MANSFINLISMAIATISKNALRKSELLDRWEPQRMSAGIGDPIRWPSLRSGRALLGQV